MSLRTSRRVRARIATVAAVLAALASGLVATGPAAQAQPVESGSLSFTSEPGDYIGGGRSYAYSAASGDSLNVSSSTDGRVISLSVDGANGDWWYLDLAAPSGSSLAPGEYTGATRYPFNSAAQPGLSLFGNGRGCNTLTGSFTISRVVLGPEGYVEALDATFEQHCEGGDPALRGEVHVDNPPAPPALDLAVGVAVDGTASTLNGKAAVHGTVTCNKPVDVRVSGDVTEVVKDVLVRGSYTTSVPCTPDAAVPWEASAAPNGTTPFQKGTAEVAARVSASDPDYGQTVTVSRTAVVELDKKKP